MSPSPRRRCAKHRAATCSASPRTPAWGGTRAEVARTPYLVLSTHGGLRGEDGRPIALGYHTGHWEVGLLVRAAAETIRESGGLPFAAYCTDPCDGRTQGTPGMMDSLPFRNDAAIVMRRQIRSLPRRAGVLGVATCDKGLPATMLALAGCPDLAGGDRSRGRHAAGRGERGRRGRPDPRGALRPRARGPGRGGGPRLPGLRLTRRRVPVPRHRRHRPGRGRGPRACAAPHRARPFRRAGLARRSPALRPGAAAARRPGDPSAARAHGRRGGERHARSRGLRRIDEPRPPPAGGGPRRRPPVALGGRLAAREPRHAPPRGRAPQRPAEPPHGARLSRRRRPRGPASPATHGSPERSAF